MIGIEIKEKLNKKEGDKTKLKLGIAISIISLVSFIFISLLYSNYSYIDVLTPPRVSFILLICIITFIIGIGLIKLSVKEKDNKSNLEVSIIGTKEIYTFKELGLGPVNVILDGNWICIDRKGIFNAINHGLDGTKKINIRNITGVQFKKGSTLITGYIQLILVGSKEDKGGLMSANTDENTIVFGKTYNELAQKLVSKIESKIDELQSSQVQTIVQQPIQSKAQQIKEFKELLDEGIITEEEFDKKKSELLK